MYQPHDGPHVPVAAVAGLLTAIGEAVSAMRPSDPDPDLWAEVKVRVSSLPGSFALNAQYPSIRDEKNVRVMEEAAAAITSFVARHAQASGLAAPADVTP